MSRILSLQRQARELGRLRTGYTEPTSKGRGRPVRSDTWIVSSHAEHYVEAAAATWGGSVEKWDPQGGGAPQFRVITEATAIEAILPAGDPLSQSYELWSGGGAARRCDGITETLSNSPCMCLAQFGDQWFEQEKGKVCDPTSRLNVFLPDMPDVGVWRAETKSYYAAGELAGAVDLIRSATSPDVVLPIRLRIEQRQRKAKGQTKKFPVIVVELRGITTGQVLTGSVQGAALESSQQRAQLTAGNGAGEGQRQLGTAAAPVQDPEFTKAAIAQASTRDDLMAIWQSIPEAARTAEIKQAFAARGAQLAHGGKTAKTNDSTGPKAAPGATQGPNVDALWQQVLATGAPKGWTTQQVEDDFASVTGVDAGNASASHMQTYLAMAADRGPEGPDDEGQVDEAEYLDAVAEDAR